MNSCDKCDTSTKCKYNSYDNSCESCLFELSYVDVQNKEDPCNDCVNGSNFVYFAIGK